MDNFIDDDDDDRPAGQNRVADSFLFQTDEEETCASLKQHCAKTYFCKASFFFQMDALKYACSRSVFNYSFFELFVCYSFNNCLTIKQKVNDSLANERNHWNLGETSNGAVRGAEHSNVTTAQKSQ